jgi:hypothetical protein
MSRQRISHGRHCTCGACAAEDWTDPDLAPCGMHGSACPALYQPWGVAGTYFDPAAPLGSDSARIADLEARLAAAELRLALLEAGRSQLFVGTSAPARIDCGCPPNHVCMNTACPRAIRVTCT